MSTNRRLFLQQLGAAGIVSLGISPPAFLSRAAWAVEAGENKPNDGRILVLVQMAGGNDGLNTVIPHSDPEYYKARPGLGIPKPNVLKIDDTLGLHPQMTGFKELYDEGRLAIVQGSATQPRSFALPLDGHLTRHGPMPITLGRLARPRARPDGRTARGCHA